MSFRCEIRVFNSYGVEFFLYILYSYFLCTSARHPILARLQIPIHIRLILLHAYRYEISTACLSSVQVCLQRQPNWGTRRGCVATNSKYLILLKISTLVGPTLGAKNLCNVQMLLNIFFCPPKKKPPLKDPHGKGWSRGKAGGRKVVHIRPFFTFL